MVCLILDLYFDWLCRTIIFVKPAWYITQSVNNADFIYEDRVSLFHFHYFQLSFHRPFFSRSWPRFRIIYYYYFFELVYHACWLYCSCKFHEIPWHIVIGALIPTLDISGNIVLWFLESPVFNIVESLNITIVGVLYFSVGEGLVSVTSSSFNCFKDLSFFPSNLNRCVVSARILAYLGSVLV